jgi:hypothetical protein
LVRIIEKLNFDFSMKQYITNVFGSILEGALTEIEMERRDILREEAKIAAGANVEEKHLEHALFTAEGSLIKLAKYILSHSGNQH